MSAATLRELGVFEANGWGMVHVLAGHYLKADGPLSVSLILADGEPLATLSVNMYRPQCSGDSRDLPPDCFYVKCWEENASIAAQALESGLFIERHDLPEAHSWHVHVPVWQVKPQ